MERDVKKVNGAEIARELFDAGLTASEVAEKLQSLGYLGHPNPDGQSVNVTAGLYDGWDHHPEVVKVTKIVTPPELPTLGRLGLPSDPQ